MDIYFTHVGAIHVLVRFPTRIPITHDGSKDIVYRCINPISYKTCLIDMWWNISFCGLLLCVKGLMSRSEMKYKSFEQG